MRVPDTLVTSVTMLLLNDKILSCIKNGNMRVLDTYVINVNMFQLKPAI